MKKSNRIISLMALWAVVALVLLHSDTRVKKEGEQDVPGNSQSQKKSL